MSETTFAVVKIVVSIVATFIGLYLIPYIHEKTEDMKYKKVKDEVKTAVKAAEQTVKGCGMGAIKKSDVLDYITNWLKSKNINITAAQLDILIESAVYWMKHPKEAE